MLCDSYMYLLQVLIRVQCNWIVCVLSAVYFSISSRIFSLCHVRFLFNIIFQFLRDLDDEISAIRLEEESLKRKMNGKLLVYHVE